MTELEELKSENERLRQAYKYIHASRNSVDQELNEAQKELSSLRSELAEKEKENSELKEFGASIHVSNELAHYKALCEAADKVIHAYYNPHLDDFDRALEVYDQLKNTKP